MSAHETYLTTLHRIPDDVILSMATRPIDLNGAFTCICGWAAREVAARERNVDAEEFGDIWVVPFLEERLGADLGWHLINGASPGFESGDALEEAFVERVLECVP